MPIQSRVVLTCGHCGSPKAEANGWYIVFASPKAVTVRRAMEQEDVSKCEGADAACGQECALKMVSKGLTGLAHTAHQTGEWKRKR